MRPVSTQNTNAISTTAMVTAPHWRASQAGMEVLRRGGNAIEAVVAAGAALSVLYPHFCGLGGDAVWMVADRAGAVKAFLGIGQAAANIPPGDAIPLRGPASALTSACLVDSWRSVLAYSAEAWLGKAQLADLLEDAIILADQGFPVSQSQTFWHDFRKQEMAEWPGFAGTFVGVGMQRQPALARTLKTIARRGARDFYEGELAAEIAKGLREAGSPVTSTDLLKTSTRMEEPLSIAYRDVTLFAPPRPTQGVTTLGIMGVLENLPMAEFDPSRADYYHYLIEAVKQAFLDRSHISDPVFADPSIAFYLLDRRHLARKAAAISPTRALPWPHPFQQGDTAFLAAVDAEGHCASVLQSIYFDWGSGVIAGDTGILWQNRGAAFSRDPQNPNRLEPGKRPFYTLNPGMALKHGRPHLIYGTQGADGQPQTLALLISLMIDHGLDPLAALSRPRFLLGKTFSDSRDTVKIEANIGKETIAALSALGHEVSEIDAFSQIGGQAGILRLDANGLIQGAHDPRSDGGALGL